MKIDSTVKAETGFVTAVTAVLLALMQAIYLVCGAWSVWVLAAGVWTSLLSVLNFLLLGITLQHALSQKDPEAAKKRIKASQSLRLLMLLILVGSAAWAGTSAGVFGTAEIIALIIPLLFVRLTLVLRGFMLRRTEPVGAEAGNTSQNSEKEEKDEK